MHSLKFGHAALASDLIEEFRAPIIDKVVVEFANSGQVHSSDFYRNESGAIYMTQETSRTLTDLLSNAALEGRQYFRYLGDKKHYGFRVMLDMKINSLIQAIEKGDPSLFMPFVWTLDSGR